MRRFLAAFLIGMTASFPAVVLAQTDGSIEPETPPASDAPQGSPADEVPSEERPTVADPAPTTPDSVPATEASSETVPPPVETAPASGTLAVQLTQSQTPPAQPNLADEAGNANSVPGSPSLEDGQEALETVAGVVPSALQPWLYALAGAIAAIVAMLGIQELSRRFTKNSGRSCSQCGRGGHGHGAGSCATCNGLGLVEEEYEGSVECPRCRGEGEEPCEECAGAGKVAEGACGLCRGSGMKRSKDGEPIDCSACQGEGEVSGTLTRNKPCPDCGGT